MERIELGDQGTVDLRVRDREGLAIHFQPVVDLTDGVVVGAEALLRWVHPRYGELPAAEFLDLAVNAEARGSLEDRALVMAAGAWVDLRERLGHGVPDLYLNMSPLRLCAPEGVDHLRHVLVATDLPPEHVVVEITGAGSLDPQPAATAMHRLTELGIRVALDDVGASSASLSWLRELSVTIVKVHPSLVRDVDRDARARQLLAHLAEMARALELDAIVEGVETEAEADAVVEAGFRFAQGRWYGPPVGPDRFSAEPRPIGPLATADR